MTDIAEIKNRLVNIGLAVSDLPIVPAMVERLAEQIAQYVEQQSAALEAAEARVEELERHIRGLALTHTPEAMKLWRGECKHYWLTDQDGEVCRRCAAEAEIARLREALLPIRRWLDHIAATGSRRLSDDEYPPISGAPKMGQLRALAEPVAVATPAAPCDHDWIVCVMADDPRAGKKVCRNCDAVRR